jgi:hypothetical protein
MSVAAVPDSKRPLFESIAHYVKNPPENSRVFKITSELARQILDLYHNVEMNRTKKPSKIKQYSEDMQNGDWGVTGDTLKFSNQGKLRDGHNRLLACIKAETPFTTHVVFGIEDSLFDVMDRGKPRSGDDVLKIDGYKNTSVLAAAIRWVRLIETNRVKLRDTFEPKDLREWVKNDYPKLPDFIAPATAVYKITKFPVGLAAAILYEAAKRDKAKAADFGRIWALGGAAPHGKPITHLLKRLQDLNTQSQGRVNDVVRAALAIQAWNLFSQRKPGQYAHMKWSLTDAFPTIR